MRLKTNLVISVIFIALLGFVYFYEIKGGEARAVEAERARQLLDFGEHEAQRITIDRGDTVLVLQREEGAWRLVSPIQTGADADAVTRYLGALTEMEVEGDPLRDSAAVAAASGMLSAYGLDTPRLRVHVDLLADGAALDTLRFGDDTPTDRFTYVQRGATSYNPEILRVRAWRFDNVDKTAFDLRDRRLLAFEPNEVRSLRLQRQGQPVVEASRTANGWRLDAPIVRPADDTQLNELLTALQTARTDRILSEAPTPEQLRQAGLVAGQAATELTVWLGEDRAEKRLLLGAAVAEDGSLQGRDSSRDHLFAVDSTVVTRLGTSVEDLRDKRIVHVDPDDVSTIALHEAGVEVWAASRDSSGAWGLSRPAGRQPKVWRFTTLLSDLDGLEATRFVADEALMQDLALAAFGLDAPEWVILLTRTDGSQVRLQAGARRDGETYVMAHDVASIYAIDEDAAQGLRLSLDDVSTIPAPVADGEDSDPAASP